MWINPYYLQVENDSIKKRHYKIFLKTEFRYKRTYNWIPFYIYTKLWTVLKKLISKPFRRPPIILLHTLLRMTKCPLMYLGMARMAQTLQVHPVKHQPFHCCHTCNAFNGSNMMYLACKRTDTILCTFLANRTIFQFFVTKFFPSCRINQPNVYRVTAHNVFLFMLKRDVLPHIIHTA